MRLKTRLALVVVLFMSAFVVCHSLLQLLGVAERADAENDGALPWVLTLLPDRSPPVARDEAEALERLVHLVRGIDGIRHVRIELHAADGRLLAQAPSRARAVPGWLYRWLAKPQPPVRKEVQGPGGRAVAYFLVTPSTGDELAEIWEDFIRNTLLVMGLSLAAMALIVGSTFRALKPLDRIRDALQALGDGRRGARLPAFHNPEVDGIAQSFNRMAAALEAAQAQRQTLLRRLVDSDENTRRTVAHDLHDELSPYLVALQPLARTLDMQCATRPDLADIGGTARTLIAHQSRILATLRNILTGLHPPDLETLGLREALARMAAQAPAAGEGPPALVRLHADGDWQGFGPTLDVSIYRMVQECLTNARRHGRPGRIDITFDTDARLDDGRPALRITVANDGVRPGTGTAPAGLGSLGMRDRCIALGGSFQGGPAGASGGSWRVEICLPLDADHPPSKP
ncbi:HAMP domain-containing protein [Aquincola sp. MAHUQ-54]|uniref:HAMP domain-containing protein n=1 Tax=Aquincola agrisoli TaxID=3119538 RepID=A0AAW9QEF7_9BURK